MMEKETRITSHSAHDPVIQSEMPATPEATTAQRATRIGLALIVAFAIIGAAWYMGERQGWADIGTGGVNATLLPRVGQPAPELFTVSENGQPVLLSQLRGTPVWINFWGSWCPPCRSEMPEVQEAYETLASRGVTVLSIAMQESTQTAVEYRDSVGATFPVYTDPTRLAALIDPEDQPDLARQLSLMTAEWRVQNFPTHIFIDADGIIRAVIMAQMTYDEFVHYGDMVLIPQTTVQAPHAIRNEQD